MTKRKKQPKTFKVVDYVRKMQKKGKDITCIDYLRAMRKEVEQKEGPSIYLDAKAQRRILNRLLRQIGLAEIKRNEPPLVALQRLHERASHHVACLEECFLWHEQLTPHKVRMTRKRAERMKAREEQIAERAERKAQREALAKQKAIEERQQNEMFPNLIAVRDEIAKLKANSRGLASDATIKLKRLIKMDLGASISWPLPSWRDINSGHVYGQRL
jgi:hypothetical protein